MLVYQKQEKNMKWLTIIDIKRQLRLDTSDDDQELELYGSAAEDTMLNYLNRSYQELLETYGDVPAPVRQATLMLVDSSYNHRSPASVSEMYYVLYGFDTLVKPYMRLTSNHKAVRPDTYTVGSQLKILIVAELPDGLTMLEVPFTVTVYNADEKDNQHVYAKTDCIYTDDGNYVVLVDSEELGVGTYMIKLVVDIPDTDYPTGYRKVVKRIDPNVKVTG